MRNAGPDLEKLANPSEPGHVYGAGVRLRPPDRCWAATPGPFSMRLVDTGAWVDFRA